MGSVGIPPLGYRLEELVPCDHTLHQNIVFVNLHSNRSEQRDRLPAYGRAVLRSAGPVRHVRLCVQCMSCSTVRGHFHVPFLPLVLRLRGRLRPRSHRVLHVLLREMQNEV
jgi:hypothetical protein